MRVPKNVVGETKLDKSTKLPDELRLQDSQMAMQNVYDFFNGVNTHLIGKGLERFDDMLRPAIMSRS